MKSGKTSRKASLMRDLKGEILIIYENIIMIIADILDLEN